MSGLRAIRMWVGGAALAAGLLGAGVASASTLPVSKLWVTGGSLTVAITGDGSYSTGPLTISPPVDIVMGTFQDPILSLPNLTSSSGSITGAKIYSTGLYGQLAPSGTADPGTGALSVDLTSVRLSGSVTSVKYGTFSLDVPLFSSPLSGTYTPGSGAYSLSIDQTTTLNIAPFSLSFHTTGTLSGTVAVVPLPASLALMVPGLLALVGVARRRAAR